MTLVVLQAIFLDSDIDVAIAAAFFVVFVLHLLRLFR